MQRVILFKISLAKNFCLFTVSFIIVRTLIDILIKMNQSDSKDLLHLIYEVTSGAMGTALMAVIMSTFSKSSTETTVGG